MATTRKPILISGAGISSLLLAQALTRASIPCLIFERDASISFRAQGYRLRLSTEGLDAIEKVLGPEAFQKFWDKCGKTGGGGFAIIDANTGIVEPAQNALTPEAAKQKEKEKKDEEARERELEKARESGDLKRLPEVLSSRGGKVVGIARGAMRESFLEGCESLVKWSHHVTGYELTPTGVHAIFADGSKSVEGELLVGGEGIYSKVAKQVSKGKLKVYDTGAMGIHGQAPTTAFKELGEGVWSIIDKDNPKGTVFAITNVRPEDMNDPDVIFGWTMGAAPGVIKAPGGNFSTIGKAAADIAKELSANWHPKLRSLTDSMIEADAAFWKITCSTPGGVPEWENVPRVTVIGDAAHSMTPAGGIGANTAVRDSELLGRLLAEAGGYADGVTAAYEKEMRVYGSQAVATSYGMAKGNFGINIDENSSEI